MNTKGFALVLLASALLSAASTDRQPSSEKQTTQRQTATQRENSSSTPIPTCVVELREDITGSYGSGETYQYYGNVNYGLRSTPKTVWENVAEVASIISAIAVAVFTGMLWWTSKHQWRAMLRQAEALDKTLAETAKSAKAAQESVVASNTALRLAERAHVQFNSGVSFRFAGIIPVAMCYWLTNTGHTIAHIKECKAELLFSDDAPSSMYDPLVPHPPINAPDLASLGREQSFSDGCDLVGIMSDEVRGNSSGKRLWLRGFAIYFDEFGEFHVTVWCRYWIPGIGLNQSTDLAFPNEVAFNYAS